MARTKTLRKARAQKPAGPLKTLRWLLLLVALPCGLALGAGVMGYQRARLDVDALEAGVWNVPSRLFPAPLELEVGKRVPAGPLDRTLTSLGYVRVEKPRRPGEFLQQGTEWMVVPRTPWTGLEGGTPEPLAVRVEDGAVTALRLRSGGPLERAALAGEPLAEIRGPDRESRRPVPLAQMPKALQEAVVAVEDKRFREHHGLDPRSLGRAVVMSLFGRRQGGSTLTQQLAKNVFLTHERTLTRKLKEVFYALALERKYSKDQILEMYLNEIYLGQRGTVSICGMAQAAHAFFSKDLKDLTLEECALLAGMIQAPNAYAPERHPEKARQRRDVVLGLMRDQERISPAAHDKAVKAPIRVRLGSQPERFAPFVADDVAEQVLALLPNAELQTEGYAIETTLDVRIQRAAEAALERGLLAAQKKSPVPVEGTVLVLRPTTGAVLAMVGGADYARSQFNRARLARRQPGSVFKPLVVLGAIHLLEEDNVGPSTVLDDEPLTLQVNGKPWSPRNSDHKFHGKVTLRQTLEQSLNVPTVRLAQQAGLPALVDFMRSLGLTAPLQPVPSLALGSYEVTPMEVAGAYTVLAGKGVYHPPYLVRRVVDAQGQVLFTHTQEKSKAVPKTEAFMVRDMMRSVVDRGTARAARTLGYPFPAAGKTGTTSDNRDAWFVGLDGDLLVVVWVGNDDNQPTGLTGAGAALPIWVDLMKTVRAGVAPPLDPPPPGVETADVCDDTGQKAAPRCPLRHREVFWEDEAPEEMCTRHSNVVEQLGDAFLRSPQHILDMFRGIED